MNAYRTNWQIEKGRAIGKRTIRWKTNINAPCAVIQVSSRPFSKNESWTNPSLLLSEKLDCSQKRSDNFHYSIIDFNNLKQYKPFSYKKLTIIPINPRPIPPNNFTPGNRHPSWIDLGRITYPKKGPKFSKDYLNLIEASRTNLISRIHRTNYYFIRAIPVKSRSRLFALSTPSIGASIFFGGKKSEQPTFHSGVPKIGHTNMIPVKPDLFNFFCHYKVTKNIYFLGNLTWKKGQKINVCEKNDDDNFLEDVGDGIGDLVDALKDFVNYASKTYNSIKARVTVFIADLTGCTTNTCKQAIGALINTGMMCMGLPPELPNSAQLMTMGKEYLAEMASEQTVVPVDVIKYGMNKLDDEINSSVSSSESKHFMVMDSSKQYRPQILNLQIIKDFTIAGSQEGSVLTIENKERFFETVIVSLPKNKNRKIGSYNLPIFLNPRNGFRNWYNTHNLAMDQLKKPNFKEYYRLEKKAYKEYYNFYKKYEKSYEFHLTLRNTDGLKKMTLACSYNKCRTTYKSW